MQSHWNRRAGWPEGFALLALAFTLAAPAGSEEPAANPPPAPPPVELDRLLKLPSAPLNASPQRAGSASKSEWRSRFSSARIERDAAQTALDDALKKVGVAAGDTESWQMSPPGVGKAQTSDAPVNYALRQEVRRQREELTRAERQLQALTVEADLAGVPQSWRE